jgi:hypothetical protein
LKDDGYNKVMDISELTKNQQPSATMKTQETPPQKKKKRKQDQKTE